MTVPGEGFDRGLLARIEEVRRRLRGRLGGREALFGRLGGRPGGEVEFLRHRPYSPGDDLRRCDWKAFLRTGKPFLREFSRGEALSVRVVLDTSGSMAAGEPPAFRTALRLALVLMGVLREDEELLEAFAVSGRGVESAAVRGRRFGEMVDFLEGLEAGGAAAGVSGFRPVSWRRLPGVTFYVSDFYPEAEGLFAGEAVRSAYAGGNERIVFVRVRPGWRVGEGRVRLENSEGPGRMEAMLGRDAENVFLEAETRIEGVLSLWAERRGAGFFPVQAGCDEVAAALEMFRGTGLIRTRSGWVAG